MKKLLSDVVKWLTIFGNLGVLVGCFLPSVKGYGGFGGEYDTSVARCILESESGKAGVAFVIIWIAVIVSWVALTSYKLYDGSAVSVIMFGCAILGRCMYAVMMEEVYFCGVSFEEKGAGVLLLEASYIALIVAGIVALGVRGYEKYNKNCIVDSSVKGRAKGNEVHKICPKCGEKVAEKSKFCVKCGFSMEVFLCPSCGTQREKGALFCGECGKKLPKIILSDSCDEDNNSINKNCQDNLEDKDIGNIRCEKCGHSFSVEERICPKCGTDSKIMV